MKSFCHGLLTKSSCALGGTRSVLCDGQVRKNLACCIEAIRGARSSVTWTSSSYQVLRLPKRIRLAYSNIAMPSNRGKKDLVGAVLILVMFACQGVSSLHRGSALFKCVTTFPSGDSSSTSSTGEALTLAVVETWLPSGSSSASFS